jgi:hypothetical protein
MDDEPYGTNDQITIEKKFKWELFNYLQTSVYLLVMFCYVTTSPRRGIQERPTPLTHIRPVPCFAEQC